MWEDRAHRSRRDIADLAVSGLGVSELHTAAIGVVARHVGTDLTCWATIDPDTLVISTMTNGPTRSPAEYDPLLAESEYLPDQPHSFAGLARRGSTVAKLSDMSADDRRRSVRAQTVWRPLGVDQELRLMFRVDGTCWGAAGMVRSGADFTDRETDYLTALAPAIATATRLAVRSEAQARSDDVRPAIVVVGADGTQRSGTPAAQEWRDRMEDIAPGRFNLMMNVMATGARASGGFSARLRDAHGSWAALTASPLVGSGEDEVAVVIQPVSGDQLVRLLLTAYGLSPRERDICHEVWPGTQQPTSRAACSSRSKRCRTTSKSVFAKVAVRSRGELVARLRPAG